MIAVAMVAAAVGVGVDGPALRRVPYESAAPPALRCSVRAGCEVVLEPGERILFAATSYGRWSVVTADDGGSGFAPRLLLRPGSLGEADAHGKRRDLRATLTVLTTRREYVVALASSDGDVPTRLGFTYPHERAGRRSGPVPRPIAAAPSPTPAASPTARAVDQSWATSGDPSVRCAEPPFSTGHQVFCKLPAALTTAPAAFAVDGARRLPVPFHLADGYLVVDALVSPIELVVGGAHPRVATIVRAVK
jgi:Conjugal transfer protein